MNTPRRGKDGIRDPRGWVEGAKRVVQQKSPPPPEQPEGFIEGVRAEQERRRMDPAFGEAYGLGPYLDSSDDVEHLDGPVAPIAFPPFWKKWFQQQTPARLKTMNEIIDERIEREVISKWWRRIRHSVIATFVATALCAQWFGDQLAWVFERLPVFRQLWQLITGSVGK